MAKKKSKKPKAKAKMGGRLISVGEYADDKCQNDEQAEAALVYAVKAFNKYFKDGIIVARLGEDKFKVVTFGPGSPATHFRPVMWQSIKAAYEAFKEGPGDNQIYDA